MNIPDIEFLDDDLGLPPRMDNKTALTKERNFRTALSASNYMRLEKEATQRGIKPFTLTKSVMTLYIHRQLIYIKELPKDIQDAISAHYASVDRLNLAEDL